MTFLTFLQENETILREQFALVPDEIKDVEMWTFEEFAYDVFEAIEFPHVLEDLPENKSNNVMELAEV